METGTRKTTYSSYFDIAAGTGPSPTATGHAAAFAACDGCG